MELSEIQNKGFCNWCRNPLIMNDGALSEKNFIEVKGKRLGNGAKAEAVYCSDCLNKPERVRQPKAVINRDDLRELNVEDLPDAQELKQMQKERESTIKANAEIQPEVSESAPKGKSRRAA